MTATSTRSPLIGWLGVVSVTMGIFAIVTTEILPIGLLKPIGEEFHISDGTAGLMMTMPGFLAAISAPAVTVATGRIDRRLMLCALMLLLATANFLAAAAPAFWVILVSRVMVGITIGGFWSIGAGLAGRLVPQRAAATAVIFSAVPLGSVLGVPTGTFIGSVAGWRTAFVVMGILTMTVFGALLASLPSMRPLQVTHLGVLSGLLNIKATRRAMLLTFLIVLAHFGTYTYVTSFLDEVTHASPGQITALLLIYGMAGIVGNFAAGHVAGHKTTFTLSASALAGATLLLPVAGQSKQGAILLLIVWGIAYGAVPVCSQTWFAKAAPQAPEAATVLFTSSFQATFSTGALLGGAVVDAAGPSALMLCGGAIAVLMAAITRASDRTQRLGG